MKYAKKRFTDLMAQRNITAGLHEYLSQNNIPLDSSDLLRWQWVLAVSALDKYIHDIVLSGMIDEFCDRRTHTSSYNEFQLNMNIISIINSSDIPVSEFEKEVVRRNSHLAFQDPDKIADALAYFWDAKHKWDIISSKMATKISPQDLKTKLKNIVIRRNQIVHEGDYLSSAGVIFTQQPICKQDTENVITFITELVEAIDKSIT